jgi:hypothetical protein
LTENQFETNPYSNNQSALKRTQNKTSAMHMHYAAEETEALANPKTTISTNYNTHKKTSKLIKAKCKETCKLMKALNATKKKAVI